MNGIRNKFDDFLSKYKLKGKELVSDVDPWLSGFWGNETACTMTHQAVLLGIPSLQFELPPSVRVEMNTNDGFRTGFLQVIVEVYNEVVKVH